MDLSRNCIRSIERDFGKNGSLRNLKEMDLANNHIERIDENFWDNFNSIQRLNLSYNSLISVSKGIKKLHNLLVLEVTGNCLTSLPKFLMDTNLVKIGIEWPYYANESEE